MNHTNVVVIIVNYRTATLCCRALDSLAAERAALPALHCVVVDNASGDGSLAQLQSHIEHHAYGTWVTAIDAGRNGGYAFGNNLGIKYWQKNSVAPAEFFWLLNPDTFVRPGAGLALVEFMRARGACIAGSRLEDEDGTPQVSTFNFPTWRSEWLSGFGLGLLDRRYKRWRVTREVVDHEEKVDWVAGASLMLSAEVIARVGLMDERYFLYFEEVDWCLAIQRAGFDCWYLPQSRVVHEVGAATGISDVRKKQPRRPQYWFDSRRYFFQKNYGWWRRCLADSGWLIGYGLWCLRKWMTRSVDLAQQPPRLWRDSLANSVFNPVKIRATIPPGKQNNSSTR